MKKTISVLLTAVMLLLTMMLVPASAAEADTSIKLHLHSDLDGVTTQAYTKFVEIDSDVVDFNTVTRKDPVYAADYAGTAIPDTQPLKAGREYEVDYDLFPKGGYVLPETADELDMQFECDKGVRVIHTAVTYGLPGEGDTRAVHITAVVVVDGSIFQRVIGWLYDRYLKMRAWSLY